MQKTHQYKAPKKRNSRQPTWRNKWQWRDRRREGAGLKYGANFKDNKRRGSTRKGAELNYKLITDDQRRGQWTTASAE